MFYSVSRALRRSALTMAILAGGSLLGSAAASDGLPPELVESLFLEDDRSIGQVGGQETGQDIALCSCGSQSCGGCEAAYSPMSMSCNDESRGSGGLLERTLAGHSVGQTCAPPWWAHRSGFFGEYLYLNAGSSDLIYAIEGTDPNPNVSTPTGPLGIVEMSPESGFRTGFTIASSECSSLNFAYTRWDGHATDSIEATGLNVLNSQLLHPSLDNAAFSSLASTATHKMNFQTIDLNYRHLWKRTECMAVNWLAGLRYSNLEQTLNSQQTFQTANGLTDVDTKIDFEGFGLTGGLDLERYSCNTGLFLYGKGMVSLLAGDWDASYRQENQFGGGQPANRYEDFHATPILEGEVGLGWRSKTGCVRVQSGYTMAGWYEAVTTRGYIDAVRSTDLIDIGETITFSGLTSRVTIAF